MHDLIEITFRALLKKNEIDPKMCKSPIVLLLYLLLCTDKKQRNHRKPILFSFVLELEKMTRGQRRT